MLFTTTTTTTTITTTFGTSHCITNMTQRILIISPARLIINQCRNRRAAQSITLDDENDESDDEEDATSLLERAILTNQDHEEDEEKGEQTLHMEGSGNRHHHHGNVSSIQTLAKVELAMLLLDRIQREASFQWTSVQWKHSENQNVNADEGDGDVHLQPWGRVTVHIGNAPLSEEKESQVRSMQRAVDYLITAADQGAVSAITQVDSLIHTYTYKSAILIVYYYIAHYTYIGLPPNIHK